MKIGYARVSTDEQTHALQLDALKAAGCEQIYQDTITGVREARSGLTQTLSHLRAGDTLVVWKLDRLGRTLKQLIDLMNQFNTQGIGFQSLTEQIDTTTPGGKLIFHIFAALAEFERDVIRERTQAGLAAARARGKKGGRPRVKQLNDAKKVALARKLYADKESSIASICSTLGVSRTTLYRYLKTNEASTPDAVGAVSS